jgi:hypothetical protein
MPEITLKPCPHCGCPVEMHPIAETGAYRITCQFCPFYTEGPPPIVPTPPEFVEAAMVSAWNRREA